MVDEAQLHVVTIGMDEVLVDGFYNRIASKSRIKFTHLMHPKCTEDNWPEKLSKANIRFFRKSVDFDLPDTDAALLTSLEHADVPTIHNMILGDRIVSKLDYADATRYATFLAKRMIEEFADIKPSMVIGAYDGLHGGMGIAVCKYLGIPWFCKNFSIIPPGLACFCDRLSPVARIQFETGIDRNEQLARAEESLAKFEDRKIEAMAYIVPQTSISGWLRKIPKRITAVARTLMKARHKEGFKFTEEATNYSVTAVLAHFWRSWRARVALSKSRVLSEPPGTPYVFFGFHMQPESTIDVWAPFYSDQLWVVDLLARSIPPSHKLLVKIHKSDVSNYSRKQLVHIISRPGVEIVDAFADTQQFIKKAKLIIAIQGTIGLEGALYGKAVIMLGDSPYVIFDSVTGAGKITDLPALIREKLEAPDVKRDRIIEDFTQFLAPFMPGCVNDWSEEKTEEEIEGFVELFDRLGAYVLNNKSGIS